MQNHEAKLDILYRFAKDLAPAIYRDIRFMPAADPEGRFRGGINYDGRAVGLFSFIPGTQVPHFVFANALVHLNANVEYSRSRVLETDALKELMHSDGPRHLPTSGEIWRHYKGSYYEVLSQGRHSRTGERLVSYRDLFLLTIHFRPLYATAIATDEAWTQLLPDGQPRFVLAAREDAKAWVERQYQLKAENVVVMEEFSR